VAKKLAFDRILFTTIIGLMGFGLTMVYSAGAVVGEAYFGDRNLLIIKQTVAALVGLLGMWVAMHLDYRWLGRRSVVWALVGGVMGLLALALFAPELNHTRRWLYVGGFSFQPSELAKMILVIFLAYQMAKYETRERASRYLVAALAIAGSMALMVLLGRDLGSTLLLGAITAVVLFLAGMPLLQIAAATLLALPGVAAAILLEPYRRERFLAFLNPEADLLGAGFQARQSLIALGSGGLFGLGLGKSLQKLHFLPYPHSDFVFAIVGEELGLIGALGVLALFGILFWRGILAGRRAPDAFGKYLAWGLTASLVVQVLIHISVAALLLPATGVTLPFISYGGSSLVVALVSGGLILNVSQHG
jgi:cell division protein FtsW